MQSHSLQKKIFYTKLLFSLGRVGTRWRYPQSSASSETNKANIFYISMKSRSGLFLFYKIKKRRQFKQKCSKTDLFCYFFANLTMIKLNILNDCSYYQYIINDIE